jgi:hypothetical protein
MSDRAGHPRKLVDFDHATAVEHADCCAIRYGSRRSMAVSSPANYAPHA